MSGHLGIGLALLCLLHLLTLFPIIFLLARKLSTPSAFHGRCPAVERLLSFSSRRSGRWILPDEESGLLVGGSGYNTFASFDDVHPATAYSFSISELSPAVLTSSYNFDTGVSSVDEFQWYSRSDRGAVSGVDHPENPLARQGSANDNVSHIERFRIQGGGGETWLGRGSISGQLVVVKEIPDKACDWTYPAEYRMLVDVLKCESHPNINKILGYTPHVDYTELFYEYCNAGDLFSFTEKYPGAKQDLRNVPPMIINHFVASMGDALAYLHLSLPAHGGNPAVVPHAPILHGDIKLENIFLRFPGINNEYGLPDIILGDFGLSCFEAESYGAVGTPGYMDPELDVRNQIRKRDFGAYRMMDNTKIVNFSSDVYAFGVCLFRLGTVDWHRGPDELPSVPLDLIRALTNTSFSRLDMETTIEVLLSALERRREHRLTTKELYEQVPYFRQQVRQAFEGGERLPIDAIRTKPSDPNSPSNQRIVDLEKPNRPGAQQSADEATAGTLGSWTGRSITAVKSFDMYDTPFKVDFSAVVDTEDDGKSRPRPRYDSGVQSCWSDSNYGEEDDR